MLKKREMRSEEKRLLDRMRMRKQRISNMRQKAKKKLYFDRVNIVAWEIISMFFYFDKNGFPTQAVRVSK